MIKIKADREGIKISIKGKTLDNSFVLVNATSALVNKCEFFADSFLVGVANVIGPDKAIKFLEEYKSPKPYRDIRVENEINSILKELENILGGKNE